MKTSKHVFLFLILLLFGGACKKELPSLAGTYTANKIFNGETQTIELTLTEDGDLSWIPILTIENFPTFMSKFKVIDDVLIEFSQSDGCDAPGRYLYALIGQKLTFMSDNENCEKRANLLSGDWHKISSK